MVPDGLLASQVTALLLSSSELGEPGGKNLRLSPTSSLRFAPSAQTLTPLYMESSATSSDNLLRLLAWLEKNKKRVGLITAGVALVVGITAAVVYYEGQKEVRASEALSNIHKPLNPASAAPANLAQDYLKVARDFDGTTAAGRALLEAAATFYTEGNFTEAESQYKRFLNGYPDSAFLPQGMLGLASTLDAQGKTADATAKYEELRRRFPTDSVIDETKLALARIYEKQNPAEAYKLYGELIAAGSQTGIGSEAGIRQADLIEKYPDLAKTNAPAPSAVSLTPTNQMVMTLTNRPTRPATNLVVPNKPGTGTSVPLLLQPRVSTNK